jgi:hypothetical protein
MPHIILPNSTEKSALQSYIYKIYGESIKEKLFASQINCGIDPLSNHSISYELRQKMVDWLIEVTQVYKRDERVFFLSIALLDNFFANSSEMKVPSDVHSTGITCMFIASKYEDIHPLTMREIHSRIGHK